MLHIDLPSLTEFKALAAQRSDACVSIYLPTTPVTQDVVASRIEFGNLGKAALAQLEAAEFDKRRLAAIAEQLDDLSDDDPFWAYQARSLAVLVTADELRTFRLPNALMAMFEVSDRFHLKPLLRAITFPHTAFVLALSENSVRLVQVFADLPATELRVPDLPRSAADAVGRSTMNDRSPSGRIQGSEGQKVRLRQYVRLVDAALRSTLSGSSTPLIIAAADPIASLYRSANTHPTLLSERISGSPDAKSEAELAAAARHLLDNFYASQINGFRGLFELRKNQGGLSRMCPTPPARQRAGRSPSCW
jgi:Bacterial archaeo-eukaryotic release factor family 11